MSAEETRQQLLDATMKVLLEHGVEGARISVIAKEAGVTSGAIYNHFASKADLVTQAISEQSPDVIGELLTSADAGSVIEVFRTIGATLGDRTDSLGNRTDPLAPVLLELLVASTRDPEVAGIVRPTFADKERGAADVIRLAQAAGEVDGDLDAEALARFTTLLALGSLASAALDPKPVDPAAWTQVVDRFLDSVRPRKETS